MYRHITSVSFAAKHSAEAVHIISTLHQVIQQFYQSRHFLKEHLPSPDKRMVHSQLLVTWQHSIFLIYLISKWKTIIPWSSPTVSVTTYCIFTEPQLKLGHALLLPTWAAPRVLPPSLLRFPCCEDPALVFLVAVLLVTIRCSSQTRRASRLTLVASVCSSIRSLLMPSPPLNRRCHPSKSLFVWMAILKTDHAALTNWPYAITTSLHHAHLSDEICHMSSDNDSTYTYLLRLWPRLECNTIQSLRFRALQHVLRVCICILTAECPLDTSHRLV